MRQSQAHKAQIFPPPSRGPCYSRSAPNWCIEACRRIVMVQFRCLRPTPFSLTHSLNSTIGFGTFSALIQSVGQGSCRNEHPPEPPARSLATTLRQEPMRRASVALAR